ncbi:MAG: diguanylate cyclase (GGDEF)-like protein [Glaciecola sp.]|jgi:diguanylate cyclase (GGDEF)-like protein
MTFSFLLNDALKEFKRSLASKLMLGLSFLVSIGLPLSLLRWQEIGFQPIFLLHITLTIIVLACNFRPNKSNYTLDLVVIILVLSAMIIVGMLSFGLQSGVITFATFTSFLVAVLWGIRPAIWFSAFWCVFVLGLGLLFVNDVIEYSVRPDVYAGMFGSWVIVAIGSALSITLILILTSQGFRELSKQLKIIVSQQKEIEYFANHDSLTGYYSARLAMPMLENALSTAKISAKKIAVVFIDLNEFKQINDTLGHEIGDEVLASIAKLFKEEIRQIDIAVRVGGDEFLFILPNLQSSSEAVEVVNRLTNRLSSFTSGGDCNLSVGASVGIAMYPDDSLLPSKLRSFADQAMYSAKQDNVQMKFYNDLKQPVLAGL